jgi:hypothetical protein
MILTEDIHSHCKSDHVYGYAGEQVTIVSERGNTLIVEGKNGRFPVHKSKVSDGNGENIQVKEPGRCDTDRADMPGDVGKQAKPMAKTAKPGKGNKNSKAVQGPTLF